MPNFIPGDSETGEQTSQLPLDERIQPLKTKLFVPSIPSNRVPRPRLIKQINGSLEKALTLISAPAGYGKTTSICSWLHESTVPATWLSLDEGDNDPIRFLQYFITALHKIIPNIQVDLLGIFQGMQPSQFNVLLNIIINEITTCAAPLVLVLDDFHTIHAQPVLEMITYLLDHMPFQLHLVLLSRADPPLPLARLRARNSILEIREADLRFTPDEISAFLNEEMKLSLSVEDLAAMETRTEGWIAGIQLAALSMQACQDVHSFVSAFTGSHHYIMDYLVEEVLKLLPNKVRSFLLQTSILDRMCGSLCEAVVYADSAGPVDGHDMLEALEEMNLFVIPLDNERRWYRYHHLFADVLRKRLEHQSPHLLPLLHRRVSEWYEQNGFISEAIQQAIAAGDQDRAAQLIEQNGCFLLISGEMATLLNWTGSIEFQSETRPWLAIQKAWALAISGSVDRVEPTLQIPEQLLSSLEPTIEVRTMLGTIAAARAHCANLQGDTHLAAVYAQQALEQLPDCSSISRSIRSVTTSILGDASWINGNLEDATRAYIEAIRIGREAGNLHMVIIANSNFADLLVEQGQLHRAADTYARSLQMAVRPDGQRSPLAGSIYAGLSRLFYEYNRLEEAAQYLHQCIDLSLKWGDFDLQAGAYAMLARLEQVQGNPQRAQEAMRIAEQFVDEHPLSLRRSILVKSDLARLRLAQGDQDGPSRLIQMSGIMVDNEIPYQREPEYIILLRVLLARSDYASALVLSERLLQQAETAGRMALVIEILILRAIASQGKKDTALAQATLGRALSLAQPEGYVRMFLDEGEPMTRMLCQVQSRQVGAGYAADLLSKIGSISGMTQPSMQLLLEPLTPRELEVLKLIEAGRSNQEISEQLVISIPTVKRHISNIYDKLDVKTRTQAISLGKELGFFDG